MDFCASLVSTLLLKRRCRCRLQKKTSVQLSPVPCLLTKCTSPHYLTNQFSTIHCRVVQYTALHCTALHCAVLRCAGLHCTALHCTGQHCTTLHCTTLHCTALHCPAPQCYILQCALLTQNSGREALLPVPEYREGAQLHLEHYYVSHYTTLEQRKIQLKVTVK